MKWIQRIAIRGECFRQNYQPAGVGTNHCQTLIAVDTVALARLLIDGVTLSGRS